MRHSRDDVVRTAVAVLDAYGLADLTMRRLAAELGVRPSALYHHVADKQTLLALVADEVLRRGEPAPAAPGAAWDARVLDVCSALRDALLAYRDGAELVAAAHAFGLGVTEPAGELAEVLRAAGLDPALARAGARTLLHFVLGHVGEEQTRLQAASAGAIDADPAAPSDFGTGLALVVDGLRARVADPAVTGQTRVRHPRG